MKQESKKTLHTRLLEKWKWYRAWHSNPYSTLIHFVIFFVVTGYDAFLIYQIQTAIKQF